VVIVKQVIIQLTGSVSYVTQIVGFHAQAYPGQFGASDAGFEAGINAGVRGKQFFGCQQIIEIPSIRPNSKRTDLHSTSCKGRPRGGPTAEGNGVSYKQAIYLRQLKKVLAR